MRVDMTWVLYNGSVLINTGPHFFGNRTRVSWKLPQYQLNSPTDTHWNAAHCDVYSTSVFVFSATPG